MASITENRNKENSLVSFTIRVSLGVDYNGKKILKNTTFKRPPELTEKQARKAAEQYAADFEKKCRQSGAADINVKFGDYCKTYLSTAKHTLQKSTYEFYEKQVYKLIIPALGKLKLCEITPAHVQKYVNMLSGLKSENPAAQGETLSAETVDRYLTVLQAVFALAVKNGLIDNNPADRRHLNMPKKTKREIEIFTKEEVNHIIAALKDEHLQIQAVIYLDLFTGMRRGELVALKFSDIDFKNQKITIQRAAYKEKGKPAAVKAPKDNETRTIDINDNCIALLKAMKAAKIESAQRLGTKWAGNGEDWVFTQWNGEMMNPQTPTKQFSKFLAKNGIKHCKFHALRHTHATLMLAASHDLMAVKERLGHSSIETTQIYLHYIDSAGKKALEKLDMFLSQPDNANPLDNADPETELQTLYNLA